MFEFVLADVSSGFRTELKVSSDLSTPFEIERSSHKLRELELGIELKNIGDREGLIGIISARVDGHQVADTDGIRLAKYPNGPTNFLTFREVDWSYKQEILAYALLNPSHGLLVDEVLRNDTRFFVVEDGAYDIVTYSVKAQLINPCSGISIFQKCYDFRVHLTGVWSNECKESYSIGGVCGWFERSTAPNEPYKVVSEYEMRVNFDWRQVETGGLIRPQNKISSAEP
ncbi:MAG: hypothetical protein AAF636_22595 [Pseudomonadota bacterium]